MDKKFVCPICGNSDPRKIGFINGKPYCRACLSFKGNLAIAKETNSKKCELFISYPLSEDQVRCSQKALSNFKKGIDSLIYAVCGAGKTELVFASIQYVISIGGKVGFCVPRRDVVIEIRERLKNAFKLNSTVAVYGGHTEKLDADIICLTSHQLFRYPDYFDLLIIDEIDAFPFNGNETLNAFFFKSIKGHYIKMSATPSEQILKFFKGKNKDIITLFTRFHRHYLPVPEPFFNEKPFMFFQLIYFLKKFIKEEKQIFIFVPTIQQAESLFLKVKFLVKNGNYVSSKNKDREKIIKDFRLKKYKFLITTSILERGVTVDNLQVIVYNADNSIYNKQTLIQISGRVGRKNLHPTGRVIFISEKETKDIKECIEEICYNNTNLQAMF